MTIEKKAFVFVGLFVLVSMSAFSQSRGNNDEALYIIFPANSANLRGVEPEIAIRNSQTFIKVAQLLLDNPQYRVLVDGHANAVVGTSEEESASLRPLSERRAEATVNFMVSYYGVDKRRFILTGAGGGYPFGESDQTLNRRVSFFIVPPK